MAEYQLGGLQSACTRSTFTLTVLRASERHCPQNLELYFWLFRRILLNISSKVVIQAFESQRDT